MRINLSIKCLSYNFSLAIAAMVMLATSLQTVAAGTTIEEIVVTAEHRESAIGDTAIAITAFDESFIEDFGLRFGEDLQRASPSVLVESYDVAIRGVGRNFGALGGVPGVATYFNGIYSEYFGVASTENGLDDLARVEILRGPQGTLYGRNAIGGAINFISNEPSETFEAQVRAARSNFNYKEYALILSAPLPGDWLSWRATASRRTSDGTMEDVGPFARDANNIGDENYSLALKFTPTKNLTISVRGNERSARRVVGSVTDAGLSSLSENGGIVDERTGGLRNTSALAFGYRAVDAAQVDPFSSSYLTPGQPLFEYSNPITGQTVTAQRVRPGLDVTTAGFNLAFGHDPSLADRTFIDADSVRGGQVRADTNGQQDEFFDQQAVTLNVDWRLREGLTLQYLFGYSDFFYDRTSDDDGTSNTQFDSQFYVSQENEDRSHELRLFADLSPALTLTSGLYRYKSVTNQRSDTFDSTGGARRGEAVNYAGLGGALNAVIGAIGLGDGNPVNLNSARAFANANSLPVGTLAFRQGLWMGDAGTSVRSGPVTVASTGAGESFAERSAFAAYSQLNWELAPKWELTLGARWAREEVEAYESAFFYDESNVDYIGLLNLFGIAPGLTLGRYNVATGALRGDANGDVLLDTSGLPIVDDAQQLRLQNLPVASSIYRSLERQDEEWTWRFNLDYQPREKTLAYLSITTGTRSAGFNLGSFSTVSTFEPEYLTAYEIGLKSRAAGERLQFALAGFVYDYDDVQTVADTLNEFNEFSGSVLNISKARIVGLELEANWLISPEWSLGGHISWTPSEYRSDEAVIDSADPTRPQTLFDPQGLLIDLKGKQMLRIADMQAAAFLQYRKSLGNNGTLQVSSSLSWIDEVYFSAFESELDRAPDYYRWDVNVDWTSPNDAWTLGLFVRNITNTIGIQSIGRFGEGGNYRRSAVTSIPRAYGAEVRYRLNKGG